MKNLSVSQVTLFRRCMRKWYWRYIEKVKFPPSAAMVRGIDIHKGIERWLKHGLPVEKALKWTSPYVEAAKEHFPKPGTPGVFVEHPIRIATPHGIPPFIGYIDFLRLDPANVRDTKTTSNLRYAKTPEELEENEQLNVYAKWAYDEGHKGEIEVGHVYIEVRQPAPKRVSPRTLYRKTKLHQEQVEGVWDGILRSCEEMVALASTRSKALDCEPNTDACSDYGGCEYRSLCGVVDLPITGSFANKKKENKETFVPMSQLKELLAKKKAEAAARLKEAEAPEAETAEEPEPEPEKPKVKVSKGLPWMKKTTTNGAAKGAVPTGIEPPDAASRTNEGAEEAEEVIEAAEEAPKKRKRRPKGSKNKATETKDESASGASEEVQSQKKSKVANKTTKGGFRLFVGCMPSKGIDGYVLYEDWIPVVEDACNEAARSHPDTPRPDFRMLPYHEPKILFRQVLQEAIKDGIPSVLVMSPNVSFASEALAVLIPHASEVVRAW